MTLLKTSSAAKPSSRTSRIESTPPIKSSRKEERSADFPRKTTEKDLQRSLAKKQGPKWKDIQFQEEQEIDRIILSYLWDRKKFYIYTTTLIDSVKSLSGEDFISCNYV